jgi:hypothetical protein
LLTGKPAGLRHGLPLYLGLALLLAILIYLFVAAKNRKDLPQKAAPLNQKQAIVLPFEECAGSLVWLRVST